MSASQADFLAHIQAVVDSDPSVRRWRFVVDNLNIHQSESLVRWVVDESDLELDLGEKGKHGILHFVINYLFTSCILRRDGALNVSIIWSLPIQLDCLNLRSAQGGRKRSVS